MVVLGVVPVVVVAFAGAVGEPDGLAEPVLEGAAGVRVTVVVRVTNGAVALAGREAFAGLWVSTRAGARGCAPWRTAGAAGFVGVITDAVCFWGGDVAAGAVWVTVTVECVADA